MTEDTYRITTEGSLREGESKSIFISSMRRIFKLKNEVLAVILNGKPKTIKKSLDWETACKLYDVFDKSGLDVSLKLNATPETFLSGLQQTETQSILSSHSSRKTKGKSRERQPVRPDNSNTIELRVPASRLNPGIFAWRSQSKIETRLGTYTVDTNPLLGYALVMSLTIISAILLQNYFLQLVLANNIVSTGAGAISLILFMGILLYFPSLITNTRRLVWQKVGVPESIIVLQENHSLDFRYTTFTLTNQGKIIGSIKKFRLKKNRMEFYDDVGQLKFYSEARVPDDLEGSSASSVASNFLSHPIFEYIDSIKMILGLFIKQDKTPEAVSYLYENNGGSIASISKSNQLNFKLNNLDGIDNPDMELGTVFFSCLSAIGLS